MQDLHTKTREMDVGWRVTLVSADTAGTCQREDWNCKVKD